ncbi:MAG: hypothetical protein ACYS0K_21125 [Planctomycetota bacterium]
MPWQAPSHSELKRKRTGRTALGKEYEERRRRDPALALAQKLRGSARWRKVRALKLSRDPPVGVGVRAVVRVFRGHDHMRAWTRPVDGSLRTGGRQSPSGAGSTVPGAGEPGAGPR